MEDITDSAKLQGRFGFLLALRQIKKAALAAALC
jgi:hypothetical protein